MSHTAHRRAGVLLLGIVTFAIAAGAAAANSPKAAKIKTAPQVVTLGVTGSAHLTRGGTQVIVSGQISCTTGAKYRIDLWLAGKTPGAFARAKIPPKTAKAITSKMQPVNLCTGSAQQWTATATTPQKTPTVLSPGTLQACAMATASKSHLYATIEQTCTTISAS